MVTSPASVQALFMTFSLRLNKCGMLSLYVQANPHLNPFTYPLKSCSQHRQPRVSFKEVDNQGCNICCKVHSMGVKATLWTDLDLRQRSVGFVWLTPTHSTRGTLSISTGQSSPLLGKNTRVINPMYLLFSLHARAATCGASLSPHRFPSQTVFLQIGHALSLVGQTVSNFLGDSQWGSYMEQIYSYYICTATTTHSHQASVY